MFLTPFFLLPFCFLENALKLIAISLCEQADEGTFIKVGLFCFRGFGLEFQFVLFLSPSQCLGDPTTTSVESQPTILNSLIKSWKTSAIWVLWCWKDPGFLSDVKSNVRNL